MREFLDRTRACASCVSKRTPPLAFTRTCDDGISQDLVVSRRRFVRCPPDRAFPQRSPGPFRIFLASCRVSERVSLFLSLEICHVASANFRKPMRARRTPPTCLSIDCSEILGMKRHSTFLTSVAFNKIYSYFLYQLCYRATEYSLLRLFSDRTFIFRWKYC